MALSGKQMLTALWVQVIFSLGLVVLRLAVQFRRPIYPTAPSLRVRITLELLVVLAWLHYLMSSVSNTILYNYGAFDPAPKNSEHGQPQIHQADLSHSKVAILKVYYIQDIFYLGAMYCVKCHFLLFYRTVLIREDTFMHKTRIALNIATVITYAGWISETLMTIFACQPIKSNWALDETHCTPFTNKYVFGFYYAPHLASDLMVYFIPIPLLLRLRAVSPRQWLLAFLSFGSGFLCVLFASAQLAVNITGKAITTDYTLANLEMLWAIVVVCVPAFRLFLRDTKRNTDPESVVSRRRGEALEMENSSKSRLTQNAKGSAMTTPTEAGAITIE